MVKYILEITLLITFITANSFAQSEDYKPLPVSILERSALYEPLESLPEAVLSNEKIDLTGVIHFLRMHAVSMVYESLWLINGCEKTLIWEESGVRKYKITPRIVIANNNLKENSTFEYEIYTDYTSSDYLKGFVRFNIPYLENGGEK